MRVCVYYVLFFCASELWEPYLYQNDEKWDQNDEKWDQNDEKWDQNSIDNVHLQFITKILGWNRCTSNAAARGGTGRY